MTPSKFFPSPGPYRCPSTLSKERFSNSTTTTCSSAWDLSGTGISHASLPTDREHSRSVTSAAFTKPRAHPGAPAKDHVSARSHHHPPQAIPIATSLEPAGRPAQERERPIVCVSDRGGFHG